MTKEIRMTNDPNPKLHEAAVLDTADFGFWTCFEFRASDEVAGPSRYHDGIAAEQTPGNNQ
jgi:hypothetical protein